MLCHKTGREGRCSCFHCSFCSASYSETQDHSGVRSDTNIPLVATMVFTSTTSCGPPSLFSLQPGPTFTRGICLGWQVVPSVCLEALMKHYQSNRILEEVSRLAAAPRRPSTNMWLPLAHSATGQGIDPLGPTAAQIAAFL